MKNKNIRIICANVHDESNEIEVILEVEEGNSDSLQHNTKLISKWVCAEDFLDGVVFEKSNMF